MKPLEGILVVSVEQAVAAPLCSARLADAGARVIKIERAGGDFARGYDRAAKGASSYFTWINQGKESAVLDIKDAADQALLRAMIGRADVFIQNLAPGALAKLGLGSATLRTAHPRLVTCDISGYGEGDAVAGLKAYDLLIQAESGLIATSGGSGEMGRIGVSLCDIGAGVTAHAAILEALLRRANTGDGAALQISLFDVAAEWMAVPLIHQDYGAGAPAREGLRHPSIAPYGGYVCGDGRTVIISIQNEREWRRLCVAALDAPELDDDPRFISNALRVEHRDALDDAITAVTRTLTGDAFVEKLKAADIAYGAVNGVDGLSAHPALRRRDTRTPDGAALTIPAHPTIWADVDHPPAIGAPSVGADTERLRAEFGA